MTLPKDNDRLPNGLPPPLGLLEVLVCIALWTIAITIAALLVS